MGVRDWGHGRLTCPPFRSGADIFVQLSRRNSRNAPESICGASDVPLFSVRSRRFRAVIPPKPQKCARIHLRSPLPAVVVAGGGGWVHTVRGGDLVRR